MARDADPSTRAAQAIPLLSRAVAKRWAFSAAPGWTVAAPRPILPQRPALKLIDRQRKAGYVPFQWKDDATADGPPEQIRRNVAAQVEAHFLERATKVWKPGPATRAVVQAIRSLPRGKDSSVLTPARRLQLESLRAAALHEHQEFQRAAKPRRTSRHKKHEAVVLVPRCRVAPFAAGVSFTTQNTGNGFRQHDGGLPQQPNGQPILVDPANGMVGQTMVWQAAAPDASLDVTRGTLIGGWIQAGTTTPRFLEAQLSTVTIPRPNRTNGGATDGWIDLFGGGVATYRLSTDLFVFTNSSQSTSVPPAPLMHATVPVVSFSEAPIQILRFEIPDNTQKNPSGEISGISNGTWLLVLAGPVVRFTATVWHTNWSIGIDTTWSVDKICAYW